MSSRAYLSRFIADSLGLYIPQAENEAYRKEIMLLIIGYTSIVTEKKRRIDYYYYFFAQVTETLRTTTYGQICGNLVRQKFNQEDILEATAVSFNSGPDLLLKTHLLGANIGPVDVHIEVLSFGVGDGQLGLIVIAKGAEFFPSGYAGDYLFTGSFLPIYLYLTSGLYLGKKKTGQYSTCLQGKMYLMWHFMIWTMSVFVVVLNGLFG